MTCDLEQVRPIRIKFWRERGAGMSIDSAAIPIWFGGGADAVLEPVGRLGDGWFPLVGANEKCRGMIDAIGRFKEATAVAW